MKVIIDRQLYYVAFDDPSIKRYLEDILKQHHVISSKIIFNNAHEFLCKSHDGNKVNRYLNFISLETDTSHNIKGDITGTCGFMDNYTTTLAKETKSDYTIYFKNRCFERMEKEKLTPKTIYIYDFVNKFVK